jgi:hypothetical protein
MSARGLRIQKGIDITGGCQYSSLHSCGQLHPYWWRSFPGASSMSFQCDAFISYSHIDNIGLIDGSKGWITNLHRALEIRIAQLLGEKPNLWRDPKLAGNDVFEITLIEQLKHVAVLIAVVSPPYLKSEWTRRELIEFWKAAEAQGGVRFHDKARIFKVLKTPVPRNIDLPELTQLLGYEFFKFDTETGRVHELDDVFGESAQRDYWMKLDDLAHDITDLLEILRREYARGAGEVAGAAKEAVYLAETTADLKEDREATRRDLQQHGYTVLPSRGLPMIATDMKASIAEDLAQCRLSIHPIGARYGFIPEGSDKSLMEIQNELAIERGKKGGFVRLLWIPPGKRFEDERQAALVEQLRTNPSLQIGADLLETSLEDLRTVIYDRLKKPTPVAPVDEPKNDQVKVTNGAGGHAAGQAADAGQIYLIYDERDAGAVKPFGSFLFDDGFEVLRPTFQADEADVREAHEENLRVCKGALIFYGATNEAWVRRKLREIEKSVGYGRTDPLPVVSIVSLPPVTDEKQQFRTHDCPVITAASEFSSEVLAPFLSLLKPGGG